MHLFQAVIAKAALGRLGNQQFEQTTNITT
jgi:hypothetical protein